MQAMADAQRELAHLRAQQADLAARAQRTLENTVAAAAQHARDHTAYRIVHADIAKRMVHAPTVNAEILLNLSQTANPEIQIGLYLYWSTSLTDIRQGKSYGS